jgi:hypothetical protein
MAVSKRERTRGSVVPAGPVCDVQLWLAAFGRFQLRQFPCKMIIAGVPGQTRNLRKPIFLIALSDRAASGRSSGRPDRATSRRPVIWAGEDPADDRRCQHVALRHQRGAHELAT